MNLATLAQSQAERYGSRPLALVYDEPVSYEQPADRPARFSTGLKALGIGRDDRVAGRACALDEVPAAYGRLEAGNLRGRVVAVP